MIINKTQNGSTLTLALTGRLDSLTQADLAREVETVFASNLTELIFDFTPLEYISSAGLRVLFNAKKQALSLGVSMKIIGANQAVREIFEIIGFALDD